MRTTGGGPQDPARDVALVLGQAEGSGSAAAVSAVTAEREHGLEAKRTAAGSGGVRESVMMCWPTSKTGHDGGICKVQEPDKSSGFRYTQATPAHAATGGEALRLVRRRQGENEEKTLRRVSP